MLFCLGNVDFKVKLQIEHIELCCSLVRYTDTGVGGRLRVHDEPHLPIGQAMYIKTCLLFYTNIGKKAHRPRCYVYRTPSC